MRGWKRKLVKNLKLAYEAPKPDKMEKFCGRFDAPYMSMGRFFVMQIPYIRKSSWIISTLVFACGVFVSFFMKPWAVWLLSAFAPILALTVLIENGKSNACNMEELECATRFSLKALLYARMTVMAVFHGIVMAALIPLCRVGAAAPVLTVSLYILVPYLLTVFAGAVVFRKVHVRDGMSICIGLPVLISFFIGMTGYLFKFLYYPVNVKWWGLALAVLAAALAREFVLYVKKNAVRV